MKNKTIQSIENLKLKEGFYNYTVEDTSVLSRGVSVPVTITYPQAKDGNKYPMVVMVHGFGGNRHENGGFTLVSNQLAAAGFVTVRMDLPGCGDSLEPFTNFNLTNMLADVEASRLFALKNYKMVDPNRTGILGYSMGGRLSTHLVAKDPDVYGSFGALAPAAFHKIDTVFPDPENMKKIAQRDGFFSYISPWGQQTLLGVKFFEDLEQSDPKALIKDYTGDLFVIVGELDPVIPPEVGFILTENAKNASSIRTHVIKGADHGFGIFTNEPQLTQEMSNNFVDFFISTMKK